MPTPSRPAPPTEGDGPNDTITDVLDKEQPARLDSLKAWITIPSVAADPGRETDVLRSAHWLAGEMRAIGVTTDILPTGGKAAVYGELRGEPGTPTELVYSHHDVRHAKPEEWRETDPFTAVHRDGRVFGCGASDAKGQVMAHSDGWE